MCIDMKDESKIQELYSMIFNENPDSETLESLLKIFHEQNNNSMDAVEYYLRNGEKFKKLSYELEKELEIAELYYNILERMPDKKGLEFFKTQLLQNKKSLKLIEEEFRNSDEYKKITT